MQPCMPILLLEFAFVISAFSAGTASAEVQVPSAEIPELATTPLCHARNRLEYSFACFAHCQEFCFSIIYGCPIRSTSFFRLPTLKWPYKQRILLVLVL